jgi:hypothetical protein
MLKMMMMMMYDGLFFSLPLIEADSLVVLVSPIRQPPNGGQAPSIQGEPTRDEASS